MDSRKKSLGRGLAERLIFVYLVLFPLGQLIRINYNFFGLAIPIHPSDVVTFISVPIYLLGLGRQPKVFSYILGFLGVATFSLILSLTYFPISSVFWGTLYLFRLFSYSAFFAIAYNCARKDESFKGVLFNGLILVSFFTAVFGWIQYFWIPDLTSLKYIGWDDHLNRLVGTFLDPGYTGIILVFGFFAVLTKYLHKKRNSSLVLSIFFLLSTAFTYSRASYVALLAGVIWLVVKRRKFKVLFWVAAVVIIVILALPRPAGEGVRLERLQSIYARGLNYSQTLAIIYTKPLFGVGFNNICRARTELFAGEGFQSHACSGADSSLLFVVATTGVVGLLVYLSMGLRILKAVEFDIYGQTFLISSVGLITHSLFVNSLFYPWVMGWMGILLAISVRNGSNS